MTGVQTCALPICVVDLATDLIRLSGLEPGRDIEIVFTGVRPGEKLTETLFTKGERSRATQHEKIFVALDGEGASQEVLDDYLRQLEVCVHTGDAAQLLVYLQEGGAGYIPLQQNCSDKV